MGDRYEINLWTPINNLSQDEAKLAKEIYNVRSNKEQLENAPSFLEYAAEQNYSKDIKDLMDIVQFKEFNGIPHVSGICILKRILKKDIDSVRLFDVMYPRAPVPYVWHSVFDADICIMEDTSLFIPVNTARLRLAPFFGHASALCGKSWFFTYRSPDDWEELKKKYAVGSRQWTTIRNMFVAFDPFSYSTAVNLLSMNLGGNSYLELEFFEEISHIEPEEDGISQFIETNRFVQKIIKLFREESIDELADIMQSERGDLWEDEHGVAENITRWLVLIGLFRFEDIAELGNWLLRSKDAWHQMGGEYLFPIKKFLNKKHNLTLHRMQTSGAMSAYDCFK